ncbi:MAG TPA: preprotein translocase subunit SecG [Verrucomicrobiae bacterium]|nr:preprotein translocase subunit SecG [Verrucomicrobiae bacterium]
MNIVIMLLTFLLVLTCLFLCLLVLVQLPKKEAGLGQAFGSGATDALFGPGSGNMLTNMTKWVAGIFFALTLLVWILHGQAARPKIVDPRSSLTPAERAELTPQNPASTTGASTNTANTNLLGTNAHLLLSSGTNIMKAATNAAPTAPPK